jgi:rare lipoprotein A
MRHRDGYTSPAFDRTLPMTRLRFWLDPWSRCSRAATWAALAVLLSACASKPVRDGPEARPPAGLERVPDAVPRVETLRSGGPNKPYEALGKSYVPLTTDAPLAESGGASWYGRKYHGQPTASGEPYDMYAMTAAHRTMPIPSYARVRNPANGREVIVRVNDRGPFSAGRVIDLSYTAALKLGLLRGVAPVEVTRITFDEMRSGTWRGAQGQPPAATPPVAVAATVPAAPAAAPASAALPVAMVATAPAPARPPLAADGPPPGTAAAAAGFWLQLGAFRDREGAQDLQRLLLLGEAGGYSAVGVFEDGGWFRVQAGPYATRTLAQQAAEAQRRGGRAALVVERGRP